MIRRAEVNSTPTTVTERLLLVSAIVLLPLQNFLPTVSGFSVMFVHFALMGFYLTLNRPKSLKSTCLHPVFVTGYLLLVLVFLIEFSHPYSNYFELFRFAQMITGAVFIGSLCRDRQALQAGSYGYLIMGTWMAVHLLLNTYGVLSTSGAANFDEASQLRANIFRAADVVESPNTMGFYTAQGAAVALALGLTSQTYGRQLFLAVAAFCAFANFLNMSRGGVVILAISCGAVLVARGLMNLKVLIVAGVLGTVLVTVPDVVYSRMVFWVESSSRTEEGRVRVYTAAMEHLDDYLVTGVGSGNFWGPWGMASRFSRSGGSVSGSHNGLLQITIYWGLVGLMGLLALIYQAYLCLPRPFKDDGLRLTVYAVAVSSLLFLQVHHVLAAKAFSFALGLLVSSSRWIWSTRRAVRRVRTRQLHAPS